MPFPCRAHAVPLPCRAAKCLESVFPSAAVSDSHLPCSNHAVILKATAQHGRRDTAVQCCGLEKNGMVRAWHGHCMASVNQTRPHWERHFLNIQRHVMAGERHGCGMGTACYVWIGLLTGHNTRRRHNYLMVLTNSPLCRRCGAEEEISAHILC